MATWEPDFDLSGKAGATIRERAQSRHFSRSQFLFHTGDPSDGVFLILDGCVAVRVGTPSGAVATIGVVAGGECLGEQSLLVAGGRRSATAVALSEVDALYLSRVVFSELRRDDASINEFLMSVLDHRLRRVTERLVEALFTPAPERVISRILELRVQFGERTISLTQDELASMAGTTRPTVNRALRRAAAAGALTLGRSSITVVDSGLLAALPSP